MKPAPEPPAPPRLVPFIFGFAVALAAGVPTTLFLLAFLADNITALVGGVIAGLVFFGALGAVLYAARHRMFRWLQNKGTDSVQEIYAPLTQAARAAQAGDTVAAYAALEEAGRIGAAFYGWLLVRRWILRVLIGLVAAFAGLVGSALLFQQNALIKEQNEYWRDQNQRLASQIELQTEHEEHARRARYVATLYDELPSCVDSGKARAQCPPRASLRARAAVAGALVALDRSRNACSRGAALEKTIGTETQCPRADLGGVKLGRAALNGVDLRWTNLAWADFSDASLRDAQLDGAVLTSARLHSVDLSGASLQHTGLAKARLNSATLVGADLRSADLAGADLTGADLSDADLRGARLQAANLADVSLAGAQVGPDWPAPARSVREFDPDDWIRCASGRLAERRTGCKE